MLFLLRLLFIGRVSLGRAVLLLLLVVLLAR